MTGYVPFAYAFVGLLLGLVALIKVGIPIWKWASRVGAQVHAALDNLGGRAAFVDLATGKTVPAIPAIGDRLGGIEAKLDGLANTNARLDTIDARVAAHELRLDDHDTSIGLLGGGQFERGSASQLAAMEKARAGVIDVESEEKP